MGVETHRGNAIPSSRVFPYLLALVLLALPLASLRGEDEVLDSYRLKAQRIHERCLRDMGLVDLPGEGDDPSAASRPPGESVPQDGGDGAVEEGSGGGDEGSDEGPSSTASFVGAYGTELPGAVEPLPQWRIRFPHAGDEPLELLLTVQDQTVDEIRHVAETLLLVNRFRRSEGRAPVGLHLLLAESYLFDNLKLKGPEYDALVEVNPFWETHEIWLQDGGENLLLDEGKKEEPPIFAVMMTGRTDLRDFPGVMARTWGGVHFAVPGIEEDDDGNFGGNLEVLMDGRLVVGSTMSPAMRSFLTTHCATGAPVVVDSSWLEVGHVDEMLAFIPRGDDPKGTCIVKADALAGLALLRGLDEQALDVEIGAAIRNLYRHRAMLPDAFDEEEDAKAIDMFARLYALHDSLRGKRLSGARRTDAQRSQSLAHRCDRAMQLSLPGLRQPGPTGQLTRERALPVLYRAMVDGEGKAGALLPNGVNMVALGRDLLLPDPLLPCFRQQIRRTLAQEGYRVHFVPCGTYHFLQGQLHCATQVLRRVGVQDVPHVLSARPKKKGPSSRG